MALSGVTCILISFESLGGASGDGGSFKEHGSVLIPLPTVIRSLV